MPFPPNVNRSQSRYSREGVVWDIKGKHKRKRYAYLSSYSWKESTRSVSVSAGSICHQYYPIFIKCVFLFRFSSSRFSGTIGDAFFVAD